jgi:hypothetical protein
VLTRELIGFAERDRGHRGTAGEATRLRVASVGKRLGGDLVAVGVLKPPECEAGPALFRAWRIRWRNRGRIVRQELRRRGDPVAIRSNPPAALYGAPLSRQKSVVRDPATLKKLTT